jgi:sugar O-acyltransferase (sialic acid O-acetyltransferase NeuD family)
MRSLIKSQIIIIGSGGQSRMIIECAQRLKYKVKYIIDIKKKKDGEEKILSIPVKNLSYLKNIKKKTKAFLAIGDNVIRSKFYNKYKLYYDFINLVHPSSYVAKNIILGKANFIAPKAIVNSLSKIGNNCIINSGSIIEHECEINDNVHVGPGSILCGRSKAKLNVFIGSGSIIFPKIVIEKNCVIGAGSLVLNKTTPNSLYLGSPAKLKKKYG